MVGHKLAMSVAWVTSEQKQSSFSPTLLYSLCFCPSLVVVGRHGVARNVGRPLQWSRASFSAANADPPSSAANELKRHVSNFGRPWRVTNSLELVFTHPTIFALPFAGRRVGQEQALAPLTPAANELKRVVLIFGRPWWVTNSLELVFTHPTIFALPFAGRRVGQEQDLAPLTPTHHSLQMNWNGMSKNSVDRWWVTNSLELVFTHPTIFALPFASRRVGQEQALAPLTPTHHSAANELKRHVSKFGRPMVGDKLARAYLGSFSLTLRPCIRSETSSLLEQLNP